MGFLNKIFGRQALEILSEDKIEYPSEESKWECRACGSGIDPSFHKYTKQNGNYFHKMCWKKMLRVTKQKGVI